ncbi:hypothetical protein GF327_04415 [Candidatus Woesearchaeota archaeon]|nr:hypothetical protein [Candidatus Woesearchaeota archaeon]
MTKIQEELFEKIIKLKPSIKVEKQTKDGWESMSRIEYIKINDNSINFYNFKAHLDTIQKRHYMNQFCLNEISKDCENRQLSGKEEKNKIKEKDHRFHPNFLIQCEYFMFSIKTIFDTILKILKYIFPEEDIKGFGQIQSWNDDDKMKRLLGENVEWLDNFNKLRNRLTHDTIAGISSSFNHNIKAEVLTYSKRKLSIRKKNEQSGETFQLPDYFEESFKKTDTVISNFYELLLNQKYNDK